jgi:acetyl-CoA C-acetyltransferase
VSVIVSYRRTPYGRLLGALHTQSATALGAHALHHALADANVDPGDVDYVIAGQVLQAGVGQNPARQTAVAAGIPLDVPAQTLNAVCLSGLDIITQAHRLVTSGEAEVVACVGQESMSQAPHLLPHFRLGTKYGAAEVIDSMESDGLTDAFGSCSMGLSTENGNSDRGISRDQQDEWAARSHQLATSHRVDLANEIAPVTMVTGKGPTIVDHDEGVRPDTTVESLARLRPAFSADGTITAGNASPISDGAACVIVMSDAEWRRREVQGLAKIVSHAFVAGPDTSLHSQPSKAMTQALTRVGMGAEQCQVLEINEAFASVVIQSIADLGVPPERVNRFGGAIALGHPIGSSGTRIVGSLAMQLRHVGDGAIGAAGICGGGGQGAALVLAALQ